MRRTTGLCVSTRRRARFDLFRAPARRLPTVALAWLLAFAVHAAPAAADPPVFNIVFRADHTLFGYLATGVPVGTSSGVPTVITAGTYKLILDDSSGADMEFDLAGPGVKLTTNMSHTEQSSAAYFETFLPSSTYTFRDDNNPSVVWTFSTSADTLAPSPATTTTCSSCAKPETTAAGDIVGSGVNPYRGALAARVTAAGQLALSFRGKRAVTLEAGRYTVTVVDQSPSRGFVLQEARKRPETLTGVALVGRRSRPITLTAGRWMFFSPGGAKTYLLVVGA